MKVTFSLCTLLLAAMLASLGCTSNGAYNLPPAQQLLEPGPGVGGPGPGVLAPAAATMPPAGLPVAGGAVQVLFEKPEGMQVRWDVSGFGMFDSDPLIVPGRASFPQGGIYRLKVASIPIEGMEGTELYPTLEVGPVTPRTDAFLAHNALPIHFTPEDFDQVASGNFVTKVIYLPDPEFQDLALANVDTLVSTRLDPGIDPIVEADRRGTIMAVLRMGNKDLEVPGVPGSSVIPAGHSIPSAAAAAYQPPMGMQPTMMAPTMLGPTGGLLPAHVAGINAPAWGMPMSGTPIGLAGPPHIPLGGPAGLESYTVRNHTRMHIPDPTSHFKVHVKQQPGYSYPQPASRVRIREQNLHPPIRYGQPHHDVHQMVR